MLSKVLAAVLAVVVLTVGGYAYWQYTDGTTPCCGTQPTAYHTSPTEPGCCEEASRSSCMTATAISVGCCESAAQPEVLAILPREVN